MNPARMAGSRSRRAAVSKGHREFTINALDAANPLTDLLSGFNIVAI
jgi:hypothetical protein